MEEKNTNIFGICSLIFFYAKRKQSRIHIVFSCVRLYSGDKAVSHFEHGMKLSVFTEGGVVGIGVLISARGVLYCRSVTRTSLCLPTRL